TVELLRQAAPLAHIHGNLQPFPGLSTIRTAVQADIHVPLQVAGTFIAGIENSKQCSLVGRCQAGYAGGMYAVLHMLPQRNANTLVYRFTRPSWRNCHLTK